MFGCLGGPLTSSNCPRAPCATGSLQAVQRGGQSQAPVPPRLPRASGGGGRRGAGQEEGLMGRDGGGQLGLPAAGGAATLSHSAAGRQKHPLL